MFAKKLAEALAFALKLCYFCKRGHDGRTQMNRNIMDNWKHLFRYKHCAHDEKDPATRDDMEKSLADSDF
jgi:hypothetical protein